MAKVGRRFPCLGVPIFTVVTFALYVRNLKGWSGNFSVTTNPFAVNEDHDLLQEETNESLPIPILKLTICAMIRNEMPFLIEWIEFYRLQGVDRFMLYDDNSYDDTELVSLFYASKGLHDLIQVVHTNLYRHNRLFTDRSSLHDQKQRYMLNHCNKRSQYRSRWVVMVDVDEFIHSPTHGSILRYIESRTGTMGNVNDTAHPHRFSISEFMVTAVRYGSAGMQHLWRMNIAADPFQQRLVALVSNMSGDTSHPLILQANPRRAPHSSLDRDYRKQFYQICKWQKSKARSYTHGGEKSIWKPEYCQTAGIHWCEDMTQGKIHLTNVRNLRMYHYAFKSSSYVQGLMDLMKPHKLAAFENFDADWFSSRFDPMPTKIISAIKARFAYLVT